MPNVRISQKNDGLFSSCKQHSTMDEHIPASQLDLLALYRCKTLEACAHALQRIVPLSSWALQTLRADYPPDLFRRARVGLVGSDSSNPSGFHVLKFTDFCLTRGTYQATHSKMLSGISIFRGAKKITCSLFLTWGEGESLGRSL